MKLIIKEKYGVVPNSILNDPNLSLKAKGLFAYLQSKPDGWLFSVDRISTQTKDKRDSIRSAIKELEEEGYLKRIPIKENGKFIGMDYILIDKKYQNNLAENPPSENPTEEFTTSENPYDNSNIDYSKKDFSNIDINIIKENNIKEKKKILNGNSGSDNPNTYPQNQDSPPEIDPPCPENRDRAIPKIGTGLSLKQGQHNYNINNYNINNNIKEKKKEIYKEKRKDKNHSFRDGTIELLPKVYLKEEEIKKLVEDYTLDVALNSIKELYFHKETSNYKCLNDYLAILKWVIGKVLKDMGINKTRLQFDKERDEVRKENQDLEFLDRQRACLEQFFRYRLEKEQYYYDKEVFFEKLKEIIKN